MENNSEDSFITVYYAEDWRKWLIKNHLTKKKIGLILYKKHTGKPSISHRVAMEEAICFGWIDTTIKKLDEEKFVRYFVKRGDNANWSKNTLKYAKRLLKENKMFPQGILRYKQGLKKRPHDHGIPKNPEMPLELKEELEKNNLLEKFKSFNNSTKKMFYRGILRAKTKQTKEKRIASLIKQILEKNGK